MATAEKIFDLAPSQSVSAPFLVLQTRTEEIVQLTTDEKPSKSAKSRHMLTTSSPVLISTGSTPAAGSWQEIEALLAQIQQSLPGDADPKIQQLIDEINQIIAQMQSGPSDASIQAMKTLVTHLFEQINRSLPGDMDPAVKTLINSLSDLVNEAIDRAAKSGDAQDTDWFASVMKMIVLLMKMAIYMADNISSNTQNQTSFLNHIRDAAKVAGDKSVAEIGKQIKAALDAAEAAKNASFWQKLLMIIVVVVVFVFMGPVAACLTAALFFVESEGWLDKMFSSVDDPALRSCFKILFVLAVMAVGGGAAGLADGGLAAMVDASANAGADAAVDAGADAAADAGDAAAGGVRAAAKESVWNTMKGAGWSSAKNLGMQAFFSSNIVGDIVEAIVKPGNDPEKKKTAQTWTFYINVALMLATMGAALKSGAAGSSSVNMLAENLSTAAAKSTNYAIKGVNLFVKALRNPYFLSAASLTFTGLSAYYQYQSGVAKDKEADAIRDQGPYEAAYTVLISLMNTCNQWIQQTNRDSSNLMQSMTSNMDFSSFGKQGRYIAEIFV